MIRSDSSFLFTCIFLALLFVTGRNKKHRNDVLFGESKDTGLISLTINALYNSIGEHRALKYVRTLKPWEYFKLILNEYELVL